MSLRFVVCSCCLSTTRYHFPESLFWTGLIVYEKNQGEKVNHIKDTLANKYCKPVTRGREILRYKFDWGGKFIEYGDWLCRKRDSRYFERPKIVLRQTSDTLIATYIEEPFYFIDSVHSIITKSNDYTLKYLLALINSKLGEYLYKLLITETGKVFAQVKLTFVKQIPIKIVNRDTQNIIANKVDDIINLHKQNNTQNAIEKEAEMDALIFRLYNLSYNEVINIDSAFALSKEEYEKVVV